jgi:ubiquinone/menaquinone biosynthesis C-methylase UbiE
MCTGTLEVRKAEAEPLDRQWDDEGVLPAELGPDTEHLFGRMTEETLGAVHALPGERVLDVGCGRGLDLTSLHASGAVLYGFDGSHVMVRRAAETFRSKGLVMRVSCGSAEHLPFRDDSFDKVYCKGAIDHFYDPARAVSEMARVLRGRGCLVISVANFESLSCRLGRFYNRIHRAIKGRELPRPHFWEIPDDHTHKFDHRLLMKLLPDELHLDRDTGVSLLWGFPHWGEILQALPNGIPRRILSILDHVARVIPGVADVIVIRAHRPLVPETGVHMRDDVSSRERIDSDGEGMMKTYSRLQGLLLCLATSVAAVLFLIGIVMKNYWALAIPVAVGFLWLLGLGFWIGWTLFTIKVEPHRDGP